MLTEKYVDSKVLLSWSHSFIRRYMKQKYLKKVEDIRAAHRDIANYFLEAFIESKPLVDMNRNIQLRFVDNSMSSIFRCIRKRVTTIECF